MSAIGRFQLDDPGERSATLTITMTVKEWRDFHTTIVDGKWTPAKPSVLSMIARMIAAAEERVLSSEVREVGGDRDD